VAVEQTRTCKQKLQQTAPQPPYCMILLSEEQFYIAPGFLIIYYLGIFIGLNNFERGFIMGESILLRM
jgi:hypothetical protein